MDTAIPGYGNEGIPVPRVLCHSLTGVTEFPGKGTGILQNFQKFRVRVRMSNRTSRSSGYCGTGLQNSQKFRAGTKHGVPVPRVLWARAYRTFRSPGYGYECPTELTEVLCRVIPGVNTKGTVCTYPTEYNLAKLFDMRLTKVVGFVHPVAPPCFCAPSQGLVETYRASSVWRGSDCL